MAKKNEDSFGDSPVGSGGRFAECVKTMRRRENVYDPEGLCASIGRKKYGKRQFQKMSQEGRKAAGNPFVPDWQVRQIAKHIAENTMMFVLPSDTRAIAEAAAEELWELTGERPRRSLVLHVVKMARYYYEALKRSTQRHHMDNPKSRTYGAQMASLADWLIDRAHVARSTEEQRYFFAMALAVRAFRNALIYSGVPTSEFPDLGTRVTTEIEMLASASAWTIDPVTAAITDQKGFGAFEAQDNPLSDEQHMETKKITMELAERMQRLAMHEDSLGHNDQGDHWREMAQYIDGAGWAHRRAAQGIPFPSPMYAGTSGLEGAEVEVQQELEASAAANPVKGDGRWHRSTLGEANTHQMRTQKGVAICFPYRPRKFPTPSRALEDLYQREHGRKLPAGTKWLSWIRPGWPDRRRPSAPMAVTAHKTLDEAKRAGETALRKLPMPGARSNPAPRLVNEGILAGSRPIPSGLDSPRYNEGILAGSRPIPSGLGSPRVNVGLVDPPIVRRSKPEQPF